MERHRRSSRREDQGGLWVAAPPARHERDQREALAECLDGAALEVRAKLCERTNTERAFDEVRRELAARVMNLYFKRDNEHLRRVKHALRDLPREFHVMITEAMQALLRESHDAAPPRRAPLDEPNERIVSVDKPAEISQQKQVEEPKTRLDSGDKPVDDASSMKHSARSSTSSRSTERIATAGAFQCFASRNTQAGATEKTRICR